MLCRLFWVGLGFLIFSFQSYGAYVYTEPGITSLDTLYDKADIQGYVEELDFLNGDAIAFFRTENGKQLSVPTDDYPISLIEPVLFDFSFRYTKEIVFKRLVFEQLEKLTENFKAVAELAGRVSGIGLKGFKKSQRQNLINASHINFIVFTAGADNTWWVHDQKGRAKFIPNINQLGRIIESYLKSENNDDKLEPFFSGSTDQNYNKPLAW